MVHLGATHDFGDEPTPYGKDISDELGKIHEENKRKAKQRYEENKRKAKQRYEDDLRAWKEEKKKIENINKHLEEKYQQILKAWEDGCKDSILGFFKKIFGINKPKKVKLKEILPPPKFNY